ncbi:MAG: hypothetical protein QUS11_08060 [Candidatus Fermentibacter sp.]|nr:hypothetical protein [Candidatus Fermentibacter sp.]
MSGGGLTISLIPHSGKPPRQMEFSGTRLLLLRVGAGLTILILLGAILIIALGVAGSIGSRPLADRIEALEDSLEETRGLEARLDSIEAELGEIRLVRERLENISELAGP